MSEDFIVFFWFLSLIVAVGLYLFIKGIIKGFRYKRGNNPFHRICKKCGAHQIMYESVFGTWWDEVYPVGNDPECKCHEDAEQRDW